MISKFRFFYKQLLLFIIGGGLYYLIEILFRGYSHWTMFIIGGVIFLFSGRPYTSLKGQILRVWIFAIITEFISGTIINLCLGWQVWDYSKLPFNLLGQICLPFALLFLPLCAAAILLNRFIQQHLLREKEKATKT
ncbi:MAG: hypothetical protein EOM34_13995 [Clostridia bacterium]|nr:hypothetical protein [Lachnospiraceae bacterium]NCC01759.1 hypothetical protein [Clostridia bacterium]NCD03680.1 hypothetical protein [Clostridia bacterium]